MTEEQKQQWKDNIGKAIIGRKDSNETREKKRQAQLGVKKGITPWNKGKKTGPQTAESRRKKGKPLVFQGVEYNSINEAEAITGISAYKIIKSCIFIEN
jgi:hypothetical protein